MLPASAVLLGVGVSRPGFAWSSVIGAGQLYLVAMALVAVPLAAVLAEPCNRNVTILVVTGCIGAILGFGLCATVMTKASLDLLSNVPPEPSAGVRLLAWLSILTLVGAGFMTHYFSLLVYGRESEGVATS